MPTVDFPQIDPVPTGNTTLSFPVLIDGIQVSGEISAEALQDNFGAGSWQAADLISAFIANRGAIEAVGRAKLPARHAAGRALLVTGDF